MEAMRRLEAMPEVEKTSVFGTAVHAVLRSPTLSPAAIERSLSDAGLPATVAAVTPSLEDVFLDIAERKAAS